MLCSVHKADKYACSQPYADKKMYSALGNECLRERECLETFTFCKEYICKLAAKFSKLVFFKVLISLDYFNASGPATCQGGQTET